MVNDFNKNFTGSGNKLKIFQKLIKIAALQKQVESCLAEYLHGFCPSYRFCKEQCVGHACLPHIHHCKFENNYILWRKIKLVLQFITLVSQVGKTIKFSVRVTNIIRNHINITKR